jgi:multidrug efflux system outer membrane protein
MKLRILLLSLILLTTGCTMGPRYKRPTAAVPGSYRGEAPEQGAQPPNTAPPIVPLGEEKWWDIFQDEPVRTLIRIALRQNYDLRIAASRVLEAQAQLGITRADQYPTLSGGGAIADVRSSQSRLISGGSFAAQRKPREPICLRVNGHVKKLFRLWWRM